MTARSAGFVKELERLHPAPDVKWYCLGCIIIDNLDDPFSVPEDVRAEYCGSGNFLKDLEDVFYFAERMLLPNECTRQKKSDLTF